MRVVITGGAGYVGSSLVPLLLRRGHMVTVLDTFWYGDHLESHKNLLKVKGDIRDPSALEIAFYKADVVIHLACISNDPSFEMDPELGRAINLSCFPLIIQMAEKHKIKRFIYASSSSVYGVNDKQNIDETTECKPLTDYSEFKLKCEHILKNDYSGNWTIIRPATVCGYAPRLRLDLSVNILTIQALVNKKITVFGGDQLRPNINILDMCRAYELILDTDPRRTAAQTYNVGFENRSILNIAQLVSNVVGGCEIEIQDVRDNRSYHVDSSKIKMSLGFTPNHSIKGAVDSLVTEFSVGTIKDPMSNPLYYNIKRMGEVMNERKV